VTEVTRMAVQHRCASTQVFAVEFLAAELIARAGASWPGASRQHAERGGARWRRPSQQWDLTWL
jgi:hypothetical protein